MSDTFDYRFSIIPAGAIIDRRLEPRDLQVLALLGRHTKNGGWCYRSQVKMAAELGCGRGSIQRSLDRLVEAGWVEKRLRGRGDAEPDATKQPFAAHAYRPIFDNAIPEEILSRIDEQAAAEAAADDAESQGGCPPVGTGVPSQAGHPGAHTYVGTIEGTPIEGDDGGDGVRVRASELATEVATIAGFPDPKAWPPGWCGAPLRVEAWIRSGWQVPIVLAACRAAMMRKRDGPPGSIKFFEPAIAREHAQQADPLPIVTLTEREANHGTAVRPNRDAKSGLAAIDRVFERLAEVRRRDPAVPDEDVVQRLPARSVR